MVFEGRLTSGLGPLSSQDSETRWTRSTGPDKWKSVKRNAIDSTDSQSARTHVTVGLALRQARALALPVRQRLSNRLEPAGGCSATLGGHLLVAGCLLEDVHSAGGDK
jgi:hypothetical protein